MPISLESTDEITRLIRWVDSSEKTRRLGLLKKLPGVYVIQQKGLKIWSITNSLQSLQQK